MLCDFEANGCFCLLFQVSAWPPRIPPECVILLGFLRFYAILKPTVPASSDLQWFAGCKSAANQCKSTCRKTLKRGTLICSDLQLICSWFAAGLQVICSWIFTYFRQFADTRWPSCVYFRCCGFCVDFDVHFGHIFRAWGHGGAYFG